MWLGFSSHHVLFYATLKNCGGKTGSPVPEDWNDPKARWFVELPKHVWKSLLAAWEGTRFQNWCFFSLSTHGWRPPLLPDSLHYCSSEKIHLAFFLERQEGSPTLSSCILHITLPNLFSYCNTFLGRTSCYWIESSWFKMTVPQGELFF